MNIQDTYRLLLNLPDVKIDSFTIDTKLITIECTILRRDSICPHCGQPCTIVNDTKHRTLRDLNISEREVFLVVKVRQFYCSSCDKYHTETLSFADAHKSYTHRQSKYIFELCKKQSYAEVASIVHMNPKLIERMMLNCCQFYADCLDRWTNIKRIGIDEQSHRKGQGSYLCILTDLDSGIILDILADRKSTTLIAYFQSLGSEICGQITDVSCDLWATYIQVAERCLPQARITLDRFHLMGLLNKPLDKYRNELRRKHPDQEAFKKLRWILFKRYETLKNAELLDLEAAFKEDEKLKTLYFKREEFQQILDKTSEIKEAYILIDQWRESVENTEFKIFNPFVNTIYRWKKYIANYVKSKITNAVTEGLNNLVRVLRRISYGIPNFKHLRLRALAISR